MNRLTEADTGFRECGVLYVGESDSDETRFADWADMAKPYDIGTRIVRGAELAALMPGASRTFACGLYVPTDGCAEPQRAAPAIARAAQRKGAIILAHCAVRGIERAGGRAAAVITERGRIACDAVVLAGGCLVQPVLRESRHPPAAVEGAVLRDAHGTGRARGRTPAPIWMRSAIASGVTAAIRLPRARATWRRSCPIRCGTCAISCRPFARSATRCGCG